MVATMSDDAILAHQGQGPWPQFCEDCISVMIGVDIWLAWELAWRLVA